MRTIGVTLRLVLGAGAVGLRLHGRRLAAHGTAALAPLASSAVLLAVLGGCASSPGTLAAGARSFPEASARWACDDGSYPSTTGSTPGSMLLFKSGPDRRLLPPEPASTGQRWADESIAFWLRGPSDALVRTAAAVTSCREVS